MSFSTYWDLEEKTRAALSEADVQRYLDAELMLKGVLKVEPLELDEEPEMPTLQRATWYRAQGFDAVFATSDLAHKFLDLNPRSTETKRIGNDYRSMENVEYLEPAKASEVVMVSLADFTEIERHRATIEKRAAGRDANRKKRDEYERAVKLQNDALSGLWENWHSCRREAAQHRKVVDTYASYVQTAGDHDVAAKFLQKVFSVEQIKDAAEWMGVTIPTVFIADVEFAEAAPAQAATQADDGGPF